MQNGHHKNAETEGFYPQQSLENQPQSQPNFYDDTIQQTQTDNKEKQMDLNKPGKTNDLDMGGYQTAAKNQQIMNKDKPEEKGPKIKSVSFCQLFRFATKCDVLMMVIAAIFSSIQGVIMPLMTIFFADFSDSLSDSIDPALGRAAISKVAINMLLLGVAVFVSATVAIILWSNTGRRQLHSFRKAYFSSIIMKSATWFDLEKPGRLANGFFEHTDSIVQIYGTKMHMFFQIIAMVIAGFAVGFYKGWLLSLLILAASPIMVLGMAGFMYYVTKLEKTQSESYADAGSISDQSFEYIRGVKSLNGEAHEVAKYQKALQVAHDHGRKHGWKGSFYYGLFNTSWTIIYALSFLLGNLALGKQWHNHNTGQIYKVGDYIAVFFGIITGVSAIGMIAPVNKSIAAGQAAMGRVNLIVNALNKEPSGTKRPDKNTLKGEIRFENVTFAYPTAPDRVVLRNVSFTIRPGEKFAIVGPSGSGKSTVIQLIERFYDPQEGVIYLDGVDIKEFEIEQYRKTLGLVSQQPILFADTIRANLLIGLDNAPSYSDEMIWSSLERANVKNFIYNKLEKGLETYVGASGGQLSGGQKQRISIARVLLRNPKLFLFDEATSALDRQNEKEIQETIDRVCTDVTSVSIAHRLLTIKNSHQILVLVDGALEELGTHDELMQIQEGVYRDLYTKQDKGDEGDSKEKSQFEHNTGFDEFEAKEINGDENGVNIRKSSTRKESIGAQNDLLAGQEDWTESMRNIDGQFIKKADETKKDQKNGQKKGQTKGQKKGQKNDQKKGQKKDQKKDKKIDTPFAVFVQVSQYLTGKDVCYIILGVISSGFVGAVMPFIGFYFGQVLDTFGKYDFFNNPGAVTSSTTVNFTLDSLFKDGMIFFYVMLGISFGSFLFAFLQLAFFNSISENFVFKVRKLLFQKILQKDMEYFDQPENKPGQLSIKLRKDTNIIRILVSNYLGSILQALSSFLIGVIFGFVYSWRMTLLVIALSPALFVSGMLEALLMYGKGIQTDSEDQNLVQESFNNIKMVKSLVAEKSISMKYIGQTKEVSKKNFTKAFSLSIALGISQFGQFAVFAATFYFAGVWRQNHNLNMEKIMTALFSLIFGVYGAGMANQFVGDIGKAKAAANRIEKMLNEETKIEFDPEDDLYAKASLNNNKKDLYKTTKTRIQTGLEEKKSRTSPKLHGNIEFKNVWFRFPTRNTYTLRKLNLKFQAGSNCAIVGTSGSGKSTLFQLLLRFYDPQRGQILIDGFDIKSLDLKHLRSFFGLIKQEPEVFNGSIEYNLQYNGPKPSIKKLEEVSDMANATEFIQQHPDGFKRETGNRGDALSGGQKQRVTIARVLLRNPKVFLFDEATSALDTNSEKLVQNAIEKIWGDHSSLTIAHRLSTIKNCDKIFVLDKGKVAESGSYDQLMLKKGIFYEIAID